MPEDNQNQNLGDKNTNDGGADGGDKSGAGGGDKGGSQDQVARADHERALADMHKFKKEAEKLRKEKDDEKAAKLKEEKRFEELAAAKEQEAKEAREEADRIKNSFLNEKKFSAVRLAAEKLGLRPEAVSDLEELDLDKVQVETTNTGKISVLGADKFAERLKTLKPHWFADKSKPNVNTNGTRVIEGGDGTVTIDDVIAAEKEGKKANDMTKYRELFKKYQQQRVAKR